HLEAEVVRYGAPAAPGAALDRHERAVERPVEPSHAAAPRERRALEPLHGARLTLDVAVVGALLVWSEVGLQAVVRVVVVGHRTRSAACEVARERGEVVLDQVRAVLAVQRRTA